MEIRAGTQETYWRRRVRRHAMLAALAASILWLVYAATPPPDMRHRLSMATAYASIVFLAASLSLGPWNLLRSRPNPISFDLRRDVGIWAGAFALLHGSIGLTVHLRGRMWMYFFKQLRPLKLQGTQFGLANYLGLLAALLFVMLLAISNDWSLRALGIRAWKSAQRWAYLATALTVIHGYLFQAVEKRHRSWILFFILLAALTLCMQIAGFHKLRRKLARGRAI
jgi:methionine sulfoxide reductase heme-binding subunit